VAARPTHLGPALAIHSSGGWLRWSRFSYELPPDQSGRRRTLWRQLRRLDAVKLQPGEWAVAHDENDDRGLDDLILAVTAAGGTSTLDLVGRSGVDDIERHVRLCRSCEALWDPFFNALDRAVHARRSGATVADVDRLRKRYIAELPRDVVLSDSARRAAERLDDLGDQVFARSEHRAPPAESSPDGRVEVVAGWALDTGAVRYVAEVRPTPTLAVERAFNTFEEETFRPTPDRIALRHGVFAFSCRRDARDEVLRTIRNRLRTFATLQG
jgi:hypothetical protein